MRIVSLLPSATEIVCELGLGEQLVGVTHECDYPAWVTKLPQVTRTFIPRSATSQEIDGLVRDRLQSQRALYSLDCQSLARLQPELIVTQGVCEVCAVAESEVTAAVAALPHRPRVVNLEPSRLSDVLDAHRTVAEAANVPHRADAVIDRLRQRVEVVWQRSQRIVHRPRVVLLEWIDPPFCSGHWSPEIVRLAGGVEALGNEGQPSRTLAWDEVCDSDPDVLVIACCGFTVERTLQDIPILTRYPGFQGLRCVREGAVFVLDGNAYFNRPGPRLIDSLEILANALHPTLHPLPQKLPAPRRLTPAELGLGESSEAFADVPRH